MPYTNLPESLWSKMDKCVEDVMSKRGVDKSRAIAICHASIAPKKSALEFPMVLTKADVMSDGRIRWRGRANTGEFDQQHERFDASFWDDVIANFMSVQETITKGLMPDLPIPIIDVSHASLFLVDRNAARVGWISKCWKDGQALMATGYFDDSPLGRLAAKAAIDRPVERRRLSVCVMPDYTDGMVKRTEEGTIYTGGHGRAYLDSIAMTAAPVDPGTILEISEDDSMATKQKSIFDDALDVLGDSDESQEAIAELKKAAKRKSAPDGVKIKADEEETADEVNEVDEVDVEETDEVDEEESDADAAGGADPEDGDGADPEDGGEVVLSDVVTMEALREIVKSMTDAFGSALADRLAPIEEQIDAVSGRVDALAADQTSKVKAAMDSPDGDWFATMVSNSIQRKVKGGGHDGKQKGQPKTAPSSEYSEIFGNPD